MTASQFLKNFLQRAGKGFFLSVLILDTYLAKRDLTISTIRVKACSHIVIKQGSQSRIDPRATFQRKNPPQAEVNRRKCLRGPQTTRKDLKIS
jgi:hypothetical protein